MLFATVNQDVYGEGTSYTSPFSSSRNAVFMQTGTTVSTETTT
jgi:hypothetical protein